jgi:hypothetical protein
MAVAVEAAAAAVLAVSPVEEVFITVRKYWPIFQLIISCMSS